MPQSRGDMLQPPAVAAHPTHILENQLPAAPPICLQQTQLRPAWGRLVAAAVVPILLSAAVLASKLFVAGCVLPAGLLFTALHAADADQITQFLFPPERLPAHTQVTAVCWGGNLGTPCGMRGAAD